MPEHAVIIRFDYTAASLDPLHRLEDRLTERLAEAGGECDGHDITPDLSSVTIYLYGPDAESLFDIARRVVTNAEGVANAVATLRFGPPEDGVPQREQRLSD